MGINLYDQEKYLGLCTELTKTEMRVFKLMAEGTTDNNAIGEILGISKRTAELHRWHIMEKLQIPTMTEMLIHIAGIIGLPQKNFTIIKKRRHIETNRELVEVSPQ